MRYLKIVGLAATVAVLMSLLGMGGSGASATVLDCGEAICSTGTLIQAENDGKLILHPPIGDLECSSSKIEAVLSNAGSSTATAVANISALTLSECNSTFTLLSKGTLEFHTREAGSTNNGRLTSSGTELTTEFAGFHCIFKTSNTTFGTLTGSATTGGNATLDIEAVLPRTGGRSGSFCGSTAQWTGSYRFTSPTPLNVT